MCKTSHEELKSGPDWYGLPLLGYQDVPAFEGEPAGKLDLRNCPCCGSTLAVFLPLVAGAGS